MVASSSRIRKSTPPSKAFIVRRGDCIEVVAPYEAGLIAQLRQIRADDRYYDPTSRTWTVYEPYVDHAVRLVERHFDVEYLRADTCSVTECLENVCGRYFEHAVLGLLPGAPHELVQASFRCLAKLHHPDTGHGDTAQMARINRAYEALTAGGRS